MTARAATLLNCPIRGQLNAEALAKDGLTETEEAQRVDFLEFLLFQRNYAKANVAVETVVMRNIGNAGRNSLRADVIVYDSPVSDLAGLPMDDRLKRAVLVAEIKRESRGRQGAMEFQLEPALRVLPSMATLGVYWDDEHRELLSKKLDNGHVIIRKDSVASLPMWGHQLSTSSIKFDMLTEPKNLLKTLTGLADIMRSQGIEDKKLRYQG